MMELRCYDLQDFWRNFCVCKVRFTLTSCFLNWQLPPPELRATWSQSVDCLWGSFISTKTHLLSPEGVKHSLLYFFSPIREDLCFIHLTLSELHILGPLMHTSTLNTCISPFPANLTIDNACQRTFGRGRESPLPSGLQAMLQVSPPLLSLSEANFL